MNYQDPQQIPTDSYSKFAQALEQSMKDSDERKHRKDQNQPHESAQPPAPPTRAEIETIPAEPRDPFNEFAQALQNAWTANPSPRHR